MRRWFSVDGFGPDDPQHPRPPQDKWAAVILAVFVLGMGIVYSNARNRKAAAQPKPQAQAADTRPVNHLAGSASPYLLAHAHNPVDWYPWGLEALERARKENRPIFLSVGYSACHWCHVMEREDFENADIAHIMNANFICIKVDREERPDIDDQYQPAVQLITGSGGWPMSVWLTPDLKPFHAGTYLPPTEFESVLGKVASLWTDKRAVVEQQANSVVNAMQQMSAASASKSSGAVPADIDVKATAAILADYDKVNGGFGTMPKFPEAPRLLYLISREKATHQPNIASVLTTTLDHMAAGGLRDQLDGGFHRYSTDAKWLVPHFEKMLYDQALLADTYLAAGSALSRPVYTEVGRGVLDFVLSAMTDPKTGGFYTSIDADSGGEEGRYYVWTRTQVEAVLGKDLAEKFDTVYGVAPYGNFQDEMNVLHLAKPQTGAETAVFAPQRAALLKARAKRQHPSIDDKIVCGLNGLMIEAMAKGFEATGSVVYRAASEKAGDYLATTLMKPDGSLLRMARDGVASPTPAFLEDYAFLARGMLACYHAYHDQKWLTRAELIIDQMNRRFWKKGEQACFASLGPAGAPVVASAQGEDNATPSVNGIAAQDLIDLANTTSNGKQRPALEADRYRKQAADTVNAFQSMIVRSPGAFTTLLMARGAP